MTVAQYRPLKFGITRATLRDGSPGVHYLRADSELTAYPDRLTDRLVYWARERPDQTLFARRSKNVDGSSGDWQHVSFAQALDAARRIGQGLLNRGLSAERPVLILSENDLEHALLALGCLYAGVPYCPTSPPILAHQPGLRQAQTRGPDAHPRHGLCQRRSTLWPSHAGHAGRRC